MKSAHQVTQAINSDVIPHPRDLYGCDCPEQPLLTDADLFCDPFLYGTRASLHRLVAVLELDRVDDVLQALRVVRNHGDSQ
jgi:hypothetical protein